MHKKLEVLEHLRGSSFLFRCKRLWALVLEKLQVHTEYADCGTGRHLGKNVDLGETSRSLSDHSNGPSPIHRGHESLLKPISHFSQDMVTFTDSWRLPSQGIAGFTPLQSLTMLISLDELI